MKLSKLILLAEKAKKEHGDLDVTLHQWNDTLKPHLAEGTKVLEVKRAYKQITFARTDKLKTGGWGGGPMYIEEHQKKMELRPNLLVFHIYYDE